MSREGTSRSRRDLGIAALIGLVIFGVHLLAGRRAAAAATSEGRRA